MSILLQITGLVAPVVPNGKSRISKLCLLQCSLAWGCLLTGSLNHCSCMEGVQQSRIWAGVEWQQARCPSLHFLLAEANATKLILLSTGCPSATHASLHVLTQRLLCACMSQVLCQVLSYRVSQNRHGLCPHGAYSQAMVMHNR